MVDVALQGQDLLNVVLLLLLVLSDREACTSYFLLRYLHLREKVLVLATDRLHGMLETFHLLTGVPVVGEDVLLLDFEGSRHLLRSPLLVDQLLILLLQQIVCVRAFTEFLVNEPILSG